MLLSGVADLPKGAKVTAWVEAGTPMISSIDARRMQQLKSLFKRASAVLRVTCGQDLRMALMRGMLKSLGSENGIRSSNGSHRD